MANVKVRYIGNKPIKRDTITESLAVWPGFNSVTAVPEDVAIRLCQFPTVWQLADKPVMERPAPAPVAEVAPEVAVEPEPQADSGFDKEESPAVTGSEVAPEEIYAILGSLDRDTDFTEAGRPVVAKVRERFEGREVSIQAVKAAWENFQAKG